MNLRVTATIRMPAHLLGSGVIPAGLMDEFPFSELEHWIQYARGAAAEALNAGGSLEILVQRALDKSEVN